jgi:DeoR/GlpR family transcriptional regulator of sugar metabolism
MKSQPIPTLDLSILFEYDHFAPLDQEAMNRAATSFDRETETTLRRVPAGARHAHILGLVNRNGFVSVSEVAESFAVSDMTIRRDLWALEDKGMLLRTHGGAVGVGRREVFDAAEPAFSSRRRQNATAKAAIARAAAGLIGARESIGLDVGTSTLALAEEIAGRQDITVFTGSLYAAAVLGRRNCPVHVLGGLLRAPELSVVGPNPIRQIAQFYVDKLFLGVSGVTEAGFFDYSPEDTEIKRAFIEQASQVIVLCDSSKFDHRSVSKICALDRAARLVTDRPPTDHLADALSRAGVEIMIAAP